MSPVESVIAGAMLLLFLWSPPGRFLLWKLLRRIVERLNAGGETTLLRFCIALWVILVLAAIALIVAAVVGAYYVVNFFSSF